MFGREVELGREQEEGDVRHLPQAQDDRHRRLLHSIPLLPIPQAQVCTTNIQIDVQTKISWIRVFLKGFCLKNGSYASIFFLGSRNSQTFKCPGFEFF